MSLFSAFGKASLNFVTKLGEIVAPIDDEDEVKDTNRKVENDDNQLTEDGNLTTESGDRKSSDSTSIIQQFTSISSSVNLSGALNDLFADKTPTNQTGVIKSSPVAALPTNVQTKPSSSSCMVEIEVDESFESTPLKAPPFQQSTLGVNQFQLAQNYSQSNDAEESEELFLGSQPESKQTLFLPPSQKHCTPSSSSTEMNEVNKGTSQKDNDIGGSTVRADVESLRNDNRAVDLPGAAASKMESPAPFESIVNSFPVYKPPSDAASNISRSDGAVSLTTEQKHPHLHPQQHSNNKQQLHHDQQGYTDQQGSSSSSSSSSSSHKNTTEFQDSSHQNNNNSSSSSSSSSNGDNKNLFPTTAAGFFDVNHNQRGKDGDKEKEDVRQGIVIGKSSESLSLIDHPPGAGNHALNEQLVKSMCEVERLTSEAAHILTRYEEAAAAAKRSEALLLAERARVEESSGRLEDMEQEFKDLYMRMGKQGELLLEADMQKEKLAEKIAAMNAEREKERKAEREGRLRELAKDNETEREKEAAKERQEIEKNSVLDSERHRMQQRIDSLEHQLTLAIAQPMPSHSQGQEREMERERELEKELEEIKATRDMSELNMRDLCLKVAELERDKAESEERLVRDVNSARYAIEVDMAQQVDAEKEAGKNMINSLQNQIHDLQERLRLSAAVSPEGQVSLTGTGVGTGAGAGALQDLEEQLKKEIALCAVQAAQLREKSEEILICRQQIADFETQNSAVNVEEIKGLALAAANASFEAERSKILAEIDRKSVESLEKQRAEHAVKIDALMQEHRAALDIERRTASEKAESSQMERRTESMTREKSFSSLQTAFDEKLLSSDAQLASLKQQLVRSETESRQLHQVIAQLRNVRKSAKDEGDGLLAQRDELRAHVEYLTEELRKAQRTVESSTADSTLVQSLSAEVKTLSLRLTETEAYLSDSQAKNSSLESELYTRTAALEACTADSLLAAQELEGLRKQLANLHEALRQLQWRSERDLKTFHDTAGLREEEAKAAVKAAVQGAEESWKARIDEITVKLKTVEQQCQDEGLFRRQAEIDLNAEKRKMQRTLEGALAQLRNSQEGVVDRTLIANLLTSYFARRRSMDVLSLIAKILNLTDEQLETVGLKVPSKNIFSSIISSFVPGEQKETTDAEGDTLAELWVNFLLLESEQELGPDGKPLPLPPSEKSKNADPKSASQPASKGGSRSGSFTGTDPVSGLSLGQPANPKATPGGAMGGTGPPSPAKPAPRSYSFTSGYQNMGLNREGTSRSDSADNKGTTSSNSSSRSNSEIINPPGK